MQDKTNEIQWWLADSIRINPSYDEAPFRTAYEALIDFYRRELDNMQREIDFLREECKHWRKSQDYWMQEALKRRIPEMHDSGSDLTG